MNPRIYIFFLLLIIGYLSSGQPNSSWKKYILDGHDSKRSFPSTHTLIRTNKSLKISQLKRDGIEVERQFENGIYLIRYLENPDQVQIIQEAWAANNLWKLVGFDWEKDTETSFPFLLKIISNDIIDLEKIIDLKPIDTNKHIYRIYTSVEFLIENVIDHEEVRAISRVAPHPSVESHVIDMNLNPNRINRIHHEFPDIEGENMVVSIQENKYDIEDIDLINRHIESALSSGSESAHATEMATIIAGAGNSFRTGRGIARKAMITSSDFMDVLPDSKSDYEALGISVQNHSYGTQVESFYGIEAQSFDQSSFENPYLMHIFSSGNEGLTISSSGSYSGINGFANLTGNFKMAKNLLVVGATDTINREIPLSSRGPAFDGRIKPDVAAYSMVGSSNSAALASGVSVLLQERYEAESGRKLPSSLLKALLINSASDAGLPGPDHITGYGSIDAYNSLKTIDDSHYLTDTLRFDEKVSFFITVPDQTSVLKLTLCWTDPPATVGNSKALVNDLDLMLITPESDTIRPWTLQTTADSVLLSAAAVRGEDHLNNVEQISLSDPIAGTYVVQVFGYDIPEGQQPFHVAYQFTSAGTFEWDYPTGSDHMPYNGETDSYFRWKSTLGEPSGQLEFQIEGSEEWFVLDQQVDLSKGFWRWGNIPGVNTPAKARMVVGADTYETEMFTISRPMRTSLGFNCGDSLLLQWQPVENAGTYEIFVLGEQELELFQTTTDTFIILNKGTLSNPYLAVHPISGSGKPFIEGYTFDYNLQGAGCFLISFYQEVVPEDGIYLNLNLTTTYGIDRVRFERREGEEFIEIATVNTLNSEMVRILDSNPRQGYNEHRVIISLSNDEQITANASNVYFLTEKALLVFPNPILNTDPLSVYTKETESDQPVFHIYDRQGAEVLRYTLLTTQESIELDRLRAGLYFYRLEDNHKVYHGKLIIRR